MANVIRLLEKMREAQVASRRAAIEKQDMQTFRQAQSDIEAIDRALTDETELADNQAFSKVSRFAGGVTAEDMPEDA